MAEEQSGFGVSGTSIVSILAAVLLAGYAGQNLVLKDKRARVAPSNTMAPGLQQIDARLWEDPLFAAQHFVDSKKPGEAETQVPACARAAVPYDIPKTLLVMVPGGPYEQAAETRRRTRYAVISALHTGSYNPVDPEHLGCFSSSSRFASNEPQTTAYGLPSSVIPFEIFDSDSNLGKLAVVWFDENRLRGNSDGFYRTIAKVEDDFHEALDETKNDDPKTAHKRDIRVIGPYSSQVLEGLAKAQSQKSQEAAQDNIPDSASFTFYNYGATVNQQVVQFSPGGCRPVDNVKAIQPKPAVRLCQVVNTDTNLADVVREEIRTRTSRAPHIALIYESDSIYGRKLTESIKNSICSTDPQCSISSLTYLRGLDGSLPSLDRGAQAEPGANAASATKGDAGTQTLAWQRVPPYEPAEGNAQLDYLEHLPGPLHKLEHSGKKEEKLTAIGLLGTDVYDKLLLLRALKPRFPDATFFTTDLDAGLFDPTEFATTRNLVVASSFGLRPLHLPGQDIPTFRDSYQTSAFLATRLAIRDKSTDDADALVAAIARPSLYEIGRWGAFPLKGPETEPPSDDHDGQVATHSPIERIGMCLLGFAGGFFVLFELKLLRLRFFFYSFSAIWVIGSLVTLINPDWLWNNLTRYDLGEPISFNGGISIWPIIFLRLLGLAFCLFAIWRVIHRLKVSSYKLEEHFCLRRVADNGDVEPVDTALSPRAFFRGSLAALFTFKRGIWAAMTQGDTGQTSIYDGNPENYGSVKEMWLRIHPWTTPGRLVRSGVYTLLSAILFAILCCILGEGGVPARGQFARDCYLVVTNLDLLAMQFLVMLVFDATSFSSYFVRMVRENVSIWPDRTTTRYSGTTGIDGTPLADWIDVQMIGQRTQVIIELMYFPFIALAIFTISQSAIFDDVPISIPILALTAVGFGLLFYIAFRLWSDADSVRATTIEHFEEAIRVHSQLRDPKCLALCLTAIKEFKKGAFADRRQLPLVRAILLPLSSLGGSAILQQLLGP